MTLHPSRIQAILDRHGIPHKQNSVSFIFCCPRCNKKDKLYISKRNGRFVCFYCREISGYYGRPEYALADLAHKPVQEVRDELYETCPYSDGDWRITDEFACANEEIADNTPGEIVIPPDFYPLNSSEGEPGAKYLDGRGVPIEIATTYDIRYCPQKRSVVFPVIIRGRWVGYQTRVVGSLTWERDGQIFSRPKSISSLGLPRDRTVMFFDRVDSDYAIVAEGPVDSLKAHKCGGNIATMGKSVGKGQLDALIGAGVKRFYIALDPDAATEIEQLLDRLWDYDTYVMLAPPPYKDLGEMDMDAVYDLFRSASPARTDKLYVSLR